MTEVRDKVVAITGASSGIGEAIALQLAQEGAMIVLGARRPDRLKDLANRISEAGGEAVWCPIDVSRREDLHTLVDLACNTYGRLDVLVNNAGVMPISAIDDLRVDDWESMIDINIKGVLYGIAAALPVFREQGSGHVINTASTAALKVVPTMSVYAATKMAVRGISEGLRQEAGPNLKVTIITPGMTNTGGVGVIPDAAVREGMQRSIDAMAMPPAAIAGAVSYAIGQPEGVDIGEVVVRPTAQA